MFGLNNTEITVALIVAIALMLGLWGVGSLLTVG